MSVSYVSKISATDDSASQTISTSLTTTSGVTCLVVFGVHSSTSDIDSSSCTFNGVAMTKFFANNKPINTGWQVGYYLLNPYIGTATLTLTWASAVNYRILTGLTFSGVGAVGNITTASMDKSTSVTLNYGTATYNGLAVAGLSTYNKSPSGTPSGWTQVHNISTSYSKEIDYYMSVSASQSLSVTFSFGSEEESGSIGGIILYPPAPSAFNKSSPTNGVIDIDPKAITLKWGASSNLTRYEYAYGTSSTPSNWTSNSTSTSVSLPELLEGAKYYWHVRAIGEGGTTYSNGSSSAYWNFTTEEIKIRNIVIL